MQISIQSNIDRLAREIPAFYRRQIPFATSQALNDTAELSATHDARRDIGKELDNVTTWTRSGIRYRKSRKSHLVAQVVIQPDRWDYLQYQVRGGKRRPQKKLIVIPVPSERTSAGRMRRGFVSKAINKGAFWVKMRDGRVGLYTRAKQGKRGGGRGTGVKLLAYTTPAASYTEAFDYEKSVNRTVSKYFDLQFSRRLRKAIDTAKVV